MTDVHRETAAQAFGIEPAEVTDAQREFAKRANFMALYGSPGPLTRLGKVDDNPAPCFRDDDK